MLSADKLSKHLNEIRPNKLSDLIRIQSVWHSDGIPERIFQKKLKKKIQQTTERKKKFSGGKDLKEVLVPSWSYMLR